MKNLYLDQNVLGFVAEGKLSLRASRPVRWIYSDEHLAEIARGERVELLEVLRDLKAQRIFLQGDGRGRITDNWVIEQYVDPSDLYQKYKIHPDGAPLTSIFSGLIATLFGAQDKTLIESYPGDIADQVRRLLEDSPLLGEIVGAVAHRAGEATKQGLSGGLEPLEKRRTPLGLHKGQASSFSHAQNPLRELWEHANKHCPPTITADQFFGFDPVDGVAESFGYEKWPVFLGISSCYHLLNAIGFMPDKGLTKTSRVPANSSDAHHVAYAGFCDGLISADTRMCGKAIAIYKYRGLGVGVLDVSEKLAD